MNHHIHREDSPLLPSFDLPENRETASGRRSAKLLKGVACVLLLSELLERTTFYSITTYANGLTINYTRFDDSSATEVSASVLDSVVLKLFTAVSYFLPLFGGAVGDAKRRRLHVLLLGCLLYLAGAVMITWGHNSHENVSAAFMYICLVLVALGMACLKSNIPALGAMYWLEGSTTTREDEYVDISQYFHWYFCFVNIGAFLGVFPCSGFWDVACYVAMVTSLLNVVTISIVCFIAPPLRGGEQDTGRALVALLMSLCSDICGRRQPTQTLHIKDAEVAKENAKSLGQLMMFFGPFILFKTTYLQLVNAFGQLGAGYPVRTNAVELNGATYYVIDALTIVILTPIFVWVLLPWVDRRCPSSDLPHHKVGYELTFRNSPKQTKGFTMGMFVATFGIAYGLELILTLIFSRVKTDGYPWYPLADEDISASVREGHDGLQYYIFVTSGITFIAIIILYFALKTLRRRRRVIG